MQEQSPTAEPIEGSTESEQLEQHYKTLAVRVDESLHAQLRFIAQLEGSSIAEEIRRAIEGRVLAAQDDPDLIARADQARREIEREAATRRDAIAGFFGKPAVAGAVDDTPATPTRPARRAAKASDE